MKHKKLSEYCTITCSPDWFKSMAVNTGYVGGPTTTGYLIPVADAERYDRKNAAKDAVVEAAGEPVKRLIKLGGCTGEICNECIDGCQHYPYCLALAALKQVRDE